MAERKIRILKTETLIRQRSDIDNELATRPDLELAIFKKVHKECNTQSVFSGKSYAGYSAGWECDVFNPKYVEHCLNHDIDSAEWIDSSRLL